MLNIFTSLSQFFLDLVGHSDIFRILQCSMGILVTHSTDILGFQLMVILQCQVVVTVVPPLRHVCHSGEF